MRKSLIHKIVIILILVFALGIATSCANQEPSTAKTPDKVELFHGDKEGAKIAAVYEDDDYTFYMTEQDINRIVKETSFSRTQDWKARIFMAPKNEPKRLKLEEEINKEIKNNSLYFNTYKIDIDQKVWAKALDIFYDDKYRNLYSSIKCSNILSYNQKGKLLSCLSTQLKHGYFYNVNNEIARAVYLKPYLIKITKFLNKKYKEEIAKGMSPTDKFSPQFIFTYGIFANDHIEYMFEDDDYRYYMPYEIIRIFLADKSYLSVYNNSQRYRLEYIIEPKTAESRLKFENIAIKTIIDSEFGVIIKGLLTEGIKRGKLWSILYFIEIDLNSREFHIGEERYFYFNKVYFYYKRYTEENSLMYYLDESSYHKWLAESIWSFLDKKHEEKTKQEEKERKESNS